MGGRHAYKQAFHSKSQQAPNKSVMRRKNEFSSFLMEQIENENTEMLMSRLGKLTHGIEAPKGSPMSSYSVNYTALHVYSP